MAVRKEPSGRWRAVIKSGRRYVAGRTFDTRREAVEWERRERAALSGGLDLAGSRQTLRPLLAIWLAERRKTVATKTATADGSTINRLPAPWLSRSVGSVTERDVDRLLVLWSEKYSEGTVTRSRASLAAFFGWCVRQHLVTTNPVSRTKVPRKDVEPTGMKPLTEVQLEAVIGAVNGLDERAADLVSILGWTGLRWSELRAMQVLDFVREPVPMLRVRQAAPEGVAMKPTKGRKSRVVPLAAHIVPLVEACAAGKAEESWLFTTSSGSRLHAARFKQTSNWADTGRGRRLHDLRHTAVCLWLARGVDVPTVQAWAGHASLATTNLYVSHLGTVADRTGLDRLNAPGHTGGTRVNAGKEDGVCNNEAPGR